MTDRLRDESSEHGEDPYVEWIAREARRPVVVDAGARARVMELVRSEPRPTRDWLRPGAARWLVSSHNWSISPLSGIALAAGLVGLGVAAGLLSEKPNIGRDGRTIGQPPVVAVPMPPLPASDSQRVQVFAVVAPQAKRVALVGDFNQWGTGGATLMERSENSGVWKVAIPLPAGRHTYAFVIEGDQGEQWIADPTAPLAPDDGFGRANSVVVVPSAL